MAAISATLPSANTSSIAATAARGGLPFFRFRRLTRPVDYLLLLDRPVDLLEVSGLKLLDEGLQKDLKRLLEISLKSKYSDRKSVVLDAQGHERAILVGHSLGAQLALHFARRQPQRAAGLVLIDPVFREALHGRWRLLAACAPLLHGAARAVRR